ncbi:hypothetical protein JW968_05940 [Candidatus Woesearchaeota archaeon]|nr:hypothetical protein [Candidatus Woesearchaeota archaeon]
MEFKLEKKGKPTSDLYPKEALDIAYDFSKKAYKEFGRFIRAIVLFGSTTKKHNAGGDIDILIVIDDLSVSIKPEVVETYRIIVEKIISETSDRIHITSLRFTSFWEYVRSGDPIAINILRDGMALLDTGFFNPLQILLYQGRIRPTAESIYVYYEKAPRTLFNAKWHLLQATIDLYWAVMDAAHAVLMKHGEAPPSPSHIADLMEEKLVRSGMINEKYARTVREFYNLSKMIQHREIKDISGEEFDRYFKEADEFVQHMRELLV